MQLMQAGKHEILLLDLEQDVVTNLASQAGFEFEVSETPRALTLELEAVDRSQPLLLFDAADPANTGWFRRCAFYVDGYSARVLQTPITVGNLYRNGAIVPTGIRLQLSKELPASFRFPGRQPVNERMIYGVLNDFLHALLQNGVGLCGTDAIVKPLIGRK
jgi:hypothetical protein